MTRRDAMQSLLAGRSLPHALQWIMSLSDSLAGRILPPEVHGGGMDRYPKEDEYPFGPMGPERLCREQRFNEHIDRCAFPVGWGANAAFGHGGPGEFNFRQIASDETRVIQQFETGAKREVRFSPHFVHMLDMPVQSPEDLNRLRLPDPNDPARYAGLAADVAWAKARGEWTIAWLNGFFSGVHLFLRDYAEFFMDLAGEPEFAQRLIATVGEWNLAAARRICATGVDCIGLCDDLGSERAMLFSPKMYREMIWPWHKRLCDLCHAAGVRVHLHSHGAILPVVPLLAEAGFDILNPLDPDDGMPLEQTRHAAGERMVLCGGMDKHFWDWPLDRQRDCLADLIKRSRKCEPFILMDSGGVPDNVTRERFAAFLAMSREARGC